MIGDENGSIRYRPGGGGDLSGKFEVAVRGRDAGASTGVITRTGNSVNRSRPVTPAQAGRPLTSRARMVRNVLVGLAVRN